CIAVSDSSLARTQEEGAASGCGDDEDDVQRRIWPARRHDDFRERPLVSRRRADPTEGTHDGAVAGAGEGPRRGTGWAPEGAIRRPGGGGVSVADGRVVTGHGFWFLTQPPNPQGGVVAYELP
ncbi:MAG TPA: hypothetical protein VKD21_16390, partial [Acidimicrobiales bacterium]|nr:hypothetical protein [Acidimicrobiales bacterium]